MRGFRRKDKLGWRSQLGLNCELSYNNMSCIEGLGIYLEGNEEPLQSIKQICNIVGVLPAAE